MASTSSSLRFYAILLVLVLTIAGLFFGFGRGHAPVTPVAHSGAEADSAAPVDAVGEPEPPTPQTDPVSGESGSSGLDPAVRAAVSEMTNTSSEGLQEQEAEDGNGQVIYLQGRFRSVPVAEINEDGDVEIRDYNSDPR